MNAGGLNPMLDRAAAAIRQGRLDEAERLAHAVLKSNWGNAPAARILGNAILLQGRPLDAVEPLQRAARRTRDAETETLLGRALAMGGRLEEGLAQFRQATERTPVYPLAFLELGARLADLGRAEEGVAVLKRGLALAPGATPLGIGLGYVHLSRNDRPAARALFAQAARDEPQRADVHTALAKVMVLDGDYSAAADRFRQAIALRPDDAQTRIDYGACLLEMGERGAGEQVLREAAWGPAELAGLATTALAHNPHGRLFLRPSAAARFLKLRPGTGGDRRPAPG